jgi:hypothetical protein
MEAFRKQQSECQTRFVQSLVNLTQQLGQMNEVQSDCDKRISALNGRLTRLSGAQSNSDKKIADLGAQLAQAKQDLGSLPKQFLDERGKGPETAGNGQFPFTSDPLIGIISHLTAKCGGNVHHKGVVTVTTNGSDRNPDAVVDIWTDSYDYLPARENLWICWNFKALRIEPTHYTLRTNNYSPNSSHLKSWVIKGSENAASWTEIDQRENNGDLNAPLAMKAFAVARSGSFRRIRLRQIGPNHQGNKGLSHTGFEVFGAVTGLQ